MTTTDAAGRGKKQRTEAQVKKAVAAYLRTTGVRYFRMQSGSILGSHKGKPWMVSLCPPGTPDFLVLKMRALDNGRFAQEVVWLEVKRPLGPQGGTGGSEQNADQIEFERVAKAHGEQYAVVRSLDDVIAAITPAGARP